MSGNNSMARMRGLALGLASALALAACTTATPYQPAMHHSQVSGGYTDTQIEANRFRVTFSGNSLTSRETVESYLLYRAGELTLAKGYDWFQMAGRDVEKKSSTYINEPFGGGFGGGFGGFGGYWGPSWRYHGAFGWRGWDPYWGGPFWGGTVDVQTVDRYEAMAEIVMGRGPKPPTDPRTFDAHEVVANLQARIVLPK